MPKVIFINAKEQKLEERVVEGLKDMQGLVGGYIQTVPFIQKLGRDNLVVDEDGLFKNYGYGFWFDGNEFAGDGFVGTLTKGDTKQTLENLKKRIQFW